MANIIETTFEEIVVASLEKIAFLFMDPIPSEESPLELDLHARILFEGPSSTGSIHLFADQSFAQEMAAGLLGIEPEEVSTEDSKNAMKELANILAGELILRLGAKKEEFFLGLPELLESTSKDCSDPHEGDCLWFHFEGEEGHLSCKVLSRQGS